MILQAHGERDIPFTILADGDYELFPVMVWRSPSSDSCGELSGPHDILRASLNGYFPMTLSISKMSPSGGHSHWGRWEGRRGALL